MSVDRVSSPGPASSSSPSSLLMMPAGGDCPSSVGGGSSLALLKLQYEQQQQQQHKPLVLSHRYQPQQQNIQLGGSNGASGAPYTAYASSPPEKGYEWFFQQFEHAIKELQLLKQQNAEMINIRDRHDQVSSKR